MLGGIKRPKKKRASEREKKRKRERERDLLLKKGGAYQSWLSRLKAKLAIDFTNDLFRTHKREIKTLCIFFDGRRKRLYTHASSPASSYT